MYREDETKKGKKKQNQNTKQMIDKHAKVKLSQRGERES